MVYLKNIIVGLTDLREGWGKGWLWLYLAWIEIRLKYVRSSLGPFWITLSTSITVLLMGPIYSYIFSTPVVEYIKFLAVSFVIWTFISQTLNEAPQIFPQNEALIKQQKTQKFVFIFKHIAKSNIVLAHNSLIWLAVLLFSVNINYGTLPLIVPGLLLVNINLLWTSIILSVIGGRYRDVQQMVQSLTQALFFLSPVMWSPMMVPQGKKFIYEFNPVYHLVEVIRAPLLGKVPPIESYLILFLGGLFGLLISLYLFSHCRNRISYWL